MKKIISIIAMVLLFVTVSPSSFASSDTIDYVSQRSVPVEFTSKIEVDGPNRTLLLDNGETLIFEDPSDYESYLSAADRPNTRTETREIELQNTRLENRLLETNYWKHKFVNYHAGTPSWVKTSQHTITAGRTYTASGSFSYKGIGFNMSTSYNGSVSSVLSADKNRYSKLGVYVDATLKRYETKQYDTRTGQLLGSWETIATNVTDTYIDVVYQ